MVGSPSEEPRVLPREGAREVKTLHLNVLKVHFAHLAAVKTKLDEATRRRDGAEARLLRAREGSMQAQRRHERLGECYGAAREAHAREQVVEGALMEAIGDAQARRKDLARKRDIIQQRGEELRRLRADLADACSALHGPTVDKLAVVQHNLTHRRWSMARRVARIFSLELSSDGLRALGASDAPRTDASGRQRGVSICGLELDSDSLAIKKNPEVMLDKDRGSSSHMEKLATALGYVAHIVQLLAAYFSVPLRYPVKPMTSRSCICDIVPDREAGGKGAAGPGAPCREVKFPLYIDHTGVEIERTRFAYGVFLLNKDIEQILNAHGMSAYGVAPHYTLPNLYRFLSCG